MATQVLGPDVRHDAGLLLRGVLGAEAVARRRIVIGYKADPIPVAPLLVVERTGKHSRRYYFWFFGFVAKLPWELELPIIY